MTIYSAMITLILVMDPFGGVPVFLSQLSHVPRKRKKIIILREMAIALCILVLFLFFGNYIMAGLSISEYALSISGGVILFIIALRMIFPRDIPIEDSKQTDEPMVVPLAVPLIAGPSTIATVTLLTAKYPQSIFKWFFALLTAWSFSVIILLFSSFIGKLLGKRVLKAIERLMGMILTTLAVQMLLRGIREFVLSVRSL